MKCLRINWSKRNGLFHFLFFFDQNVYHKYIKMKSLFAIPRPEPTNTKELLQQARLVIHNKMDGYPGMDFLRKRTRTMDTSNESFALPAEEEHPSFDQVLQSIIQQETPTPPTKQPLAEEAAAAPTTIAKKKPLGRKPKEPKETWTQEEEDALMEAVEENGNADWDYIAQVVMDRSHGSLLRKGSVCKQYWESKNTNNKKGQWSEEEDEALFSLVSLTGISKVTMEEIVKVLPGRSIKQVRERWRSNLDPSIKRDNWTPEEDTVLLEMRKMDMGWADISRMIKGRTEHMVKTRFRSMQRAEKRAWSRKEDDVITSMVNQIGQNWEAIANQLKNRTTSSVEMRWRELCAA